MILNYFLLLLSSFFLVSISIKKLIYISHKKHLFDEPDEIRKIHLVKVPNLGGVAIFISLVLSYCFFISGPVLDHANYVVGGLAILFGLGLTDDLVGVNPQKKMIIQLALAVLIASQTPLRIDQGLFPLLGIGHLSFWAGVMFTSLFIIFMMNAMNLIDGINGLAGSIGLFSSIIFAGIFWTIHDFFFLQISTILIGCLTGFLLFNFSPAKIFMGDTGSLLIGFILALFSVHLMEADLTLLSGSAYPFSTNRVPFLLSVFAIPVFDTLRMIFIRLSKKKSPFEADRNHIHHNLLELGLSHGKTTLVLIGVNTGVVVVAYLFRSFALPEQLTAISLYMMLFLGVVYFIRKWRVNQKRLKLDSSGLLMEVYTFKSGSLNAKMESSLIEEVKP